MTVLTTILAVATALAVLVVFHEFGHFLVAKLFGVGVPVFSVGMGPRLLGFVWRGTDYRLSAFPVGGYVRMAGADPFGEEDLDNHVDPDDDFMKKPIWQRLLIMAAGPAANLILPVILFTGAMMLGEPQSDTRIGTVLPDSPAEEAGFLPDDRILMVNDQPVETWLEIGELLLRGGSVPLSWQVRRGDTTHTVETPAAAIVITDELLDMEALGLGHIVRSARIGVDDPDSPAGRAGLKTGDLVLAIDGKEIKRLRDLGTDLTGERHELRILRVEEEERVEKTVVLQSDPEFESRSTEPLGPWGLFDVTLFVGQVQEKSPAEVAGIQAGDRLWQVDGKILQNWGDLTDLVGASGDAAAAEAAARGAGCNPLADPVIPKPRSLQLTLIRDGEVLTREFAPEMKREIRQGRAKYRPIMGVTQFPGAYRAGEETRKFYSFLEAVPKSLDLTWDVIGQTVGVFGRMATGELRFKETIGGPVAIADLAQKSAQRGIFAYARMIGLISVGLGLINLLPVPVLDGGQIFFYLVEGIRGRPLSLAFRERMQMVGVLLLVGLFIAVTIFDVNYLITGTR